MISKELVTEWVKALRSGKYKQGEGSLRYEGKHCCLGVLCEVANIPVCDVEHDNDSDKNSAAYTEIREMLIQAGISPSKLIGMNDVGEDFLQIADEIERTYGATHEA